MGAPLTLPPPIAGYLTRYVRLRRRQALLRASGLGACFFVAWALACCMIDRVAWLAPAARLALLAIGAAGVTILVFRPIVAWVSRGVNWRLAAAEVERADGRFEQRLRTVTSELLAAPGRAGSREMVDALAAEVGDVLTARPPRSLVNWRPAILPWLGLCLLAAAALALTWLPTVGMPQLAARFFTPLRPIPPVTTTRLTLHPQNVSIVEGEPLRVTVTAERLTGSGVTLYYAAAAGASSSWTSVPMTPTADGTFEAVVTPPVQDLRFLARGGDARTAVGHASVLRRPVMTDMRVRYTYPPYANRATLTVSNAQGLIEAPVGTEAAVTFVASQPLAAARVKVGDQAIETTSSGDDPRQRSFTTIVTKDQTYTLSLTSVDHVAGTGPAGTMIRAIPDRPPLVQVLQPPGELRLSPRDILSLPFQAIDDYGVTSLTTNVQITASGVDASGEPINLAQGKPATQPSTWGGAGAERAVDGKTDGNFLVGSVTHTDATPNPWWQVDLGNVTPVSVIELWNRADAVPERLSDFFVFVSDGPFLSDDPATITAQAGVGTFRVAGAAGRPTMVEVFRTARFVRVQLPKTEYLSLAEVRVIQAKPVAAGAAASRSFDTNLAVSGDPRQQDGEAVLDLARINVGVGDVVTVSVTAVDSGKHVGVGGPIRVVVSPRSIDQRTYDRINELKRATQLAAWLVSQLEGAGKSFDPAAAARGAGRIDAYLAALASATRELSGVPETATVLQSALLRCVVRSDAPALSVALATMIDQLQQLSASSSALGAKFAFDSAPTDADRAALTAGAATATRITGHLTAILRGEQAGAILADLDNLRASERGTPSAKEAADRARERARRVREDIAAATKELGMSPEGLELEARLKEMVAARQAATKGYALSNFEAAAQSYAAAMGSRQSLPALVSRLSAAAQAEAVRPDGNLVRARDLQLAASAALRMRDAAEATRAEFIVSFSPAVAALQREHAAGAPAPPPIPPATAPATAPATTTVTTAATQRAVATTSPAFQDLDAIRTAAADARRKLSLWARGENERAANEAEALARAQSLAMQANADLSQRQYESAEQADERIVRELRLAERTFPRAADRYEEARREIRRSTEKAKLLDRIAAEQHQVAQGVAGQSTDARRVAQEKVAIEMNKAAEDEGDGMSAEDDEDNDTRLAAVTAIRTAQERLAAMPQQLRDVETAFSERAAATARLRQLQQQAMPPDEQAAAARAVRTAEEQLRQAEQRLAERVRPLAEPVAVEVARSLSAFAPETSDAVRGLVERLAPAMSRLQRSASAEGDGVGSAVAELRGAIDGLQTQLKDAQAALLERDPLTAARAYAAAASASVASNPAAAATHQENASAALSRAWDATIHEAAAARLAGLPTMRPLFAPPPDASVAPPRGAAENVATKFPMFFDWGRLPWRPMQALNASPRASDPPGYQDALQAYFEALGMTAAPQEPKK